jgi:hypothetical protein
MGEITRDAAVAVPPVASLDESRQKALENAIQKAVQRDLPDYMEKMLRGREANAHELRGAVLGIALIADRNTADTNRRLERLEHSWLWRIIHRAPKPQKTSTKPPTT